jgi:hypothetical protein
MVKQVIQIFMVASLMGGCALKDPDLSQNGFRSGVRSGFIPNEIRRSFKGKTFALIDVLTMPAGSYTINNTKTVRGNVEFPYDFPLFTPTPCNGIGYTIAYERRHQGATTLLSVVPFVNGREIFVDHFLVGANDSLSIAVYAELAPIEPFFERGELPSNFVSPFLPSNNCRMMCGAICTDSVRTLTNLSCDIKLLGDNYACGKKVLFLSLAKTEDRFFWLSRLANCGAITADYEHINEDLKAYYSRASTYGCKSYERGIYDEWYVIQQKVPFLPPTYSITNLKEFVLATSDGQNSAIEKRPVAMVSEWR